MHARMILHSWSRQTATRMDEAVSAFEAAGFRDVTTDCGINFVHDAGPTGRYFLPQVMGSGAALFDFDSDGRLDVYLVQNGGPDSPSTNRL